MAYSKQQMLFLSFQMYLLVNTLDFMLSLSDYHVELFSSFFFLFHHALSIATLHILVLFHIIFVKLFPDFFFLPLVMHLVSYYLFLNISNINVLCRCLP